MEGDQKYIVPEVGTEEMDLYKDKGLSEPIHPKLQYKVSLETSRGSWYGVSLFNNTN